MPGIVSGGIWNDRERKRVLSYTRVILSPRQFVVHVGVDPAAKAIFLEQCSKNRGYRDADIRGFRPECGVCLPDGPEVIASEVSMKAVSRRAAVQGVEVAFSRDAVPPKSPRQKPSDLCEGETRNTGDDRVQGLSSVALNK
ncbi:hypothetical protein MJT46_012217 [Ovis ammon polii x Ovis aries]|nr:hypothetical protein MJT46_012217 [Ovis ammon polii x Ovis aries]